MVYTFLVKGIEHGINGNPDKAKVYFDKFVKKVKYDKYLCPIDTEILTNAIENILNGNLDPDGLNDEIEKFKPIK